MNAPRLNLSQTSRCSGKFVAPENSSHTQQYGLGPVRIKIRDMVKFRVRVRVRSRVKIRVRIRAKVEVRVSVSVSYIITIWRGEKFSRCDKFPTTPALKTKVELGG